MPRSLLLAVLTSALVVSAPAVTRAYEISLVYSEPSPVEGPVTVTAQIYVTIAASELPLPYVQFQIDYGCDGGADPCVLFHGHAYAEQTLSFPFYAPFTDPYPCFGITCECLSGGRYRAVPLFPAAGTFPLANVHITRVGTALTDGCDYNYVYPEVVVDWGCFDDPNCTGSGQFILQEGPLATESKTWGAVKALYR